MKYKLKDDDRVKLTLSFDEFDLLVKLMCHVRLGGSDDLGKLARQFLDAGEDVFGSGAFDDSDTAVRFRVEMNPVTGADTYDLDVMIEGNNYWNDRDTE